MSRMKFGLSVVALCALLAGAPLLGPALAEQLPAAPVTAGPVDFSGVVAAVRPAVLSVLVKEKAASGRGSMGFEGAPPELRDFFKRFGRGAPGFGDDEEGGRRARQGEGSGFFISADGYVVTNNHVVEDADEIVVRLDGGDEKPARLIGADARTDLALLKVEGSNFPHVVFGDSDQAKIGQWVVTVGNPFGLGGTATAGIVSAVGRDIGAGPYDDFIQIDAPINRGNSGGPAFNLKGEVIGVNTMIFSPSGGSVGIGFAIPANMAKTVVAQLKDDGRVDRGWLGVAIQPLTPEIAEGLGLKEGLKGAIVAEVKTGGPADKAGLEAGDVVSAIDGRPLADARELTRAVGERAPGSKAALSVLRGEEAKEIVVTLGSLDAQDKGGKHASASSSGKNDGARGAKLGFGFEDGPEGVSVTVVRPGSAADEAGLEAGDVIIGAGGKPVESAAALRDAVQGAQKDGRKSVALQVRKSKDRVVFVALSLNGA